MTGKFSKAGRYIGKASSIPVAIPASHHLKLLPSDSKMTEPSDAFDTMLLLGFEARIPIKPESISGLLVALLAVTWGYLGLVRHHGNLLPHACPRQPIFVGARVR